MTYIAAPRPDDRVLVIGAGPAGLDMALSLTDRGFSRVTVLEASDRIGGKCWSRSIRGGVVDFGAGVVPGGGRVQALCERFGVDRVPIPLHRREVSTGVELRDSWFGKVAWDLTRIGTFPPLERLIARYQAADPLSDPDHPSWTELAQPLSMVLGPEVARVVHDFCSNMLFIYGYGTSDAIPAWYGLEFWRLWLKPMADGDLHLIRDGYQSLWQAIVEQAGLEVALNQRIVRLQGSDDGVEIEVDGRVERFDFAIDSVPHQIVDPPRVDLFRTVSETPYAMGVATADGIDAPGLVSFVDWPGRVNMVACQAAIRAGRDPASGEVAAFYGVPNYHGPAIDRAQVSLERDYALRNVEIVDRHTWSYFPRFDEDALRAGAPARIWAAQGKHRIWTIGSACSMESVPNVLDYNDRLLAAAGLG